MALFQVAVTLLAVWALLGLVEGVSNYLHRRKREHYIQIGKDYS
jgi:hypothetical protein